MLTNGNDAAISLDNVGLLLEIIQTLADLTQKITVTSTAGPVGIRANQYCLHTFVAKRIINLYLSEVTCLSSQSQSTSTCTNSPYVLQFIEFTSATTASVFGKACMSPHKSASTEDKEHSSDYM